MDITENEVKLIIWDNGGRWVRNGEPVIKVIDYKVDNYRVINVEEYIKNPDNYCFIADAVYGMFGCTKDKGEN